MRVNRLELIAQLKERVVTLTQQADNEYAQALTKEQARAAEYEATTHEAWRALALRIQERLTDSEPVLETDVPKELRRMSGFGYQPREVRRRDPGTTELEQLIALLEASPDETVSLASLERAGFTLGKVIK